jgi:hypothetical protein
MDLFFQSARYETGPGFKCLARFRPLLITAALDEYEEDRMEQRENDGGTWGAEIIMRDGQIVWMK